MKIKVDWDLDLGVCDLSPQAEREGGFPPTVVVVPDQIPEDDIPDWLSDKFGFLLYGWSPAPDTRGNDNDIKM